MAFQITYSFTLKIHVKKLNETFRMLGILNA